MQDKTREYELSEAAIKIDALEQEIEEVNHEIKMLIKDLSLFNQKLDIAEDALKTIKTVSNSAYRFNHDLSMGEIAEMATKALFVIEHPETKDAVK